MTVGWAAGPVIETVDTFAPLGLAFSDLVTDARITEGLTVTARPLEGGRVSIGFQTMSGAYSFRHLDGMGDVERSDGALADSPPVQRDFVVAVTDGRDRFVDTTLVVPVPTRGLVGSDLVFGPPSLPSSPPEAPPLYLFSAPSRSLPSNIAIVRAQLATVTDRAPASDAVVEVTPNSPSPTALTYIGVSDVTGAVVIPCPYPSFGPVPGELGSPPPPGTSGTPPKDRTWTTTIRIRHEPGVLERIDGIAAPTIQSIFSQSPTDLRVVDAGVAQAAVDEELGYGRELVLRTAGDPDSYLLIGT